MSDFWVQKMRTYFSRIDFDGDGAISRADFEGMAERFASSLPEDKAATLMKNLTSVWDTYLSAVGGGSAINKDDFIAAMKKLVKDPTLKVTLEGPLPLFFHAVDHNDDGLIDEEEFGAFFRLIGLDETMAPATFQAIDTDHDGQLSITEFTSAGTEFFMSEDQENPTKIFWGPLVE